MFETTRQLFESFVTSRFAGFSVWRLTAALLVVLGGICVRILLSMHVAGALKEVAEATDLESDEYLLEKTRTPVTWIVHVASLYVAAWILELSKETTEMVGMITASVATILALWLAYRVVDVIVHHLEQYTSKTAATIDDQLVPIVRRIGKYALTVVATLVLIQQWGYDVSTLIAGLGIGGLAFALAARNMLSNWFGTLMIFTDRPFEVGEWVETPAGQGTVEEVGLRSTRIRTYGREKIIVPNSDIASQPITNHDAIDRRRILETIGLVYDTSHDQLTRVLERTRKLLDDHDAIWDDDWRVFFIGFGDSALEVEISCFVSDPSWTFYRETREELFLEVARIVEEAGTEFAYPTRSVHLRNSTAAPVDGDAADSPSE